MKPHFASSKDLQSARHFHSSTSTLKPQPASAPATHHPHSSTLQRRPASSKAHTPLCQTCSCSRPLHRLGKGKGCMFPRFLDVVGRTAMGAPCKSSKMPYTLRWQLESLASRSLLPSYDCMALAFLCKPNVDDHLQTITHGRHCDVVQGEAARGEVVCLISIQKKNKS